MAFLRAVPESFGRCELTFLERQAIDVERARLQHAGYAEALRENGLFVRVLPTDEAQPDCPFVEDLVVALAGRVHLTRPGAMSRRGERSGLAETLADWAPVSFPPGLYLDGGDVLSVGGRVFVGRSSRTSLEAIEWLGRSCGQVITPVEVTGALHLKTAVTALDHRTILIAPGLVDDEPFAGLDKVEVGPGEALAANVLILPAAGDGPPPLLVAAGFPATAEQLADRGHRLVPVALGEFHKAEAGPTCLAVLIGVDSRTP